MSNLFKDIETEQKAPNSLKKELVSEIDTIRDTANIVDLFVGNYLKAGIALLQEVAPNQPSDQDE